VSEDRALAEEERLTLDLPRFVFDHPSHANAFQLRRGGWKFGFDDMTVAAIRKHVAQDVRPQWTAEVFEGFREFRVIELGPQDGFITAGLEAFGIGSIISVEANVDSFLRCLILKNALGLKATFLLGDFLSYLETPDLRADAIYGSGVLYHLKDPVDFIQRCSEVADHLYLWTFHYDAEAIGNDAHESQCFVGRTEHHVGDQTFGYHKRLYHPEIRANPSYAGGIEQYANWMTLTDIEAALKMSGFEIRRSIPDSFQGIPAMNIWAVRVAPTNP
jgi:hypothetical protein